VLEAAARALTLETAAIAVHTAGEIERGVTNFAKGPAGALIVLPHSMFTQNRDLIIAPTLRGRLPSIYPFRHFAAAGGLMAYGIDLVEQFRQAAGYVDRIMKGEKPGDLPVQAPTKYELVINLKTAKALGLTVPDTLLARADEVIE
jgi:putative ABC transport system substrate-binding protein